MAVKRSNREIIARLEREANAAARLYADAVAEHQLAYRIERMITLVEDLATWIEEREGTRLAKAGVVLDEGDGRFVLRRGDAVFEVRTRDDMSIVVDGKIMRPNPELPVLVEDFYDEVMARVRAWIDPSLAGPRRHGA